MKVYCRYYRNTARLIDALRGLATFKGFRFYCLDGSMERRGDDFIAHSKQVTILISICTEENKGMFSVLTTETCCANYNDTSVDVEVFPIDNPIYRLCLLMLNKYSVTKSPFMLELNGDQCTIAVSIDEDAETLTAVMRGAQGEVVVSGQDNLKAALEKVTSLASFSYTVFNNDCEKTISIKKNSGAVMCEVAHYLGRTLVCASYTPNGNILEQYITTGRALEVIVSKTGVQSYKIVLPPNLQNVKAFCLYTTTSSLEDVYRKVGKECAKN